MDEGDLSVHRALKLNFSRKTVFQCTEVTSITQKNTPETPKSEKVLI